MLVPLADLPFSHNSPSQPLLPSEANCSELFGKIRANFSQKVGVPKSVMASQGVRCVDHVEFLTWLVWRLSRTTLDHEYDWIVQRVRLRKLDGFGVHAIIKVFESENDDFVVSIHLRSGAFNSRRIVRR